MVRSLILAVAVSLVFERIACGDLIFGNPITGTNPSADNPFTLGQSVNVNVSASGIGRGSGINADNASNRYSATSWNTVSLDPNAYFAFGITPTSGATISFADFVYTSQSSFTGPTNFAFRSSIDSFATNIATPAATGGTISLSAFEFQSVSSAIEFRLYGWGANSGAGTFSVNDFSFNGTVTAVPEPSSMVLLGVAGAVVGVMLCRKQKQRAVD